MENMKGLSGMVGASSGEGQQDYELYAGDGLMQSAIREWMELYRGERKKDARGNLQKNLKLPRRIAAEISRLVCLEAEFNILGDSVRAAYLKEQLRPFLARLRIYTEYAAAGGGMVFKPYVGADGSLAIEGVQADMFRPIAWNSSGQLISAAFFETKTVGKDVFLRVEKHLRDGDGYVIRNHAYKINTGGASVNWGSSMMGAAEIPLTDVPEWAAISPEVAIGGLSAPLFAYFRIPNGNTVDRSSPLGISVYADVLDLIRDADNQYDLLMWEYDGGALAIDASEDAFDHNEEGKVQLPAGRERLYRSNKFTVDDDGATDLFKTFAPQLRDESYNAGLETVFRQIENGCGLAYGTLSRADETAKTATEVKRSKQRSYATVSEIQKALQTALEGLVAAMDALCDLYALTPKGDYTTAALWDDSIVNDVETERIRDMQEVREGLMAAWEYRVKWYGEDEATAKKAVGGTLSDDQLMGFGGV